MRRSDVDRPPAGYLVAGTWPNGRVDGPPAARAVQRFCQRLVAATAGRSMRDVSRQAGIQHTTLADLLRGEAWPDAVTIAKLEAALETDLWPGHDPAP